MEYEFTESEERICQMIANAGKALSMQVYLIGGFVRDILLYRPSKDMDVVCIGDGIALARHISTHNKEVSPVRFYSRFGTAMIQYGEWEIEFVGARKESYSSDSRKPIVEIGTMREDQLRRDFTINALAISLNDEDYGTLIDPFDGLKDIENRIIRTPTDPNTTFSDDPLRMMRAIRFASQLDFDIEKKTWQGIVQNRERLSIVSMERITAEFNKIIESPIPSIGLRLLYDSGLLEMFFPEMIQLAGVETKNGISHKDNFYHTLEVLDNLSRRTTDLWLRWSAILHDIAKPATKRFQPNIGWTFHGHEVVGEKMVPKIFKRLKLPLDHKMKFVQKMVRLHLRPISLTKESITDSALRRLLYDAGDDLESLMMLCEADITSKNQNRVKRYLENYELIREKLEDIEAKDHLRNWNPPISGELIMQTFGIGPSRDVGSIKTAIREAILEGDIPNEYEAAYQLMLEIGEQLGLTPV